MKRMRIARRCRLYQKDERTSKGTVCAAVKHIRKKRQRAGSIGGTLISPLRQAAKEALGGEPDLMPDHGTG